MIKIFVTGTRGIPDIPGGVEKHCEELYPRIASKGFEVFIFTRAHYNKKKYQNWKGVNLIECWAPKHKNYEALAHTFICLLKARLYKADIIHIHAIGPSLLTPLAKLLGLKVVVTNHGHEYQWEKWGWLAKFVLKSGEKIGSWFADEVIAISAGIAETINTEYKRNANIIFNGINPPEKNEEINYLADKKIEPRKYILAVARFVPEKGLHDLVKAFIELDPDVFLVIAGDADYETNYSIKLRELTQKNNKIILTGYITGKILNEVFSHAQLFVLPSYHEGLPIALLEAISYGLPVLVSNISANKEIGLPENNYFDCGNIEDLKNKLRQVLRNKPNFESNQNNYNELLKKYDWDIIADKTMEIYLRMMKIK